MSRNATTKFVATALAVASLGIAGTAQASETGQGVAVGEPTPGQPVPAQPAGQGVPGKAPQPGPTTPQAPDNMPKPAEQDPEDVDYDSEAYFRSTEAKQRFERYCNMKDAEPSHSDKEFCERYRKVHSSSTGGHRPEYCKYTNVRYDPRCDSWSNERPAGHHEETGDEDKDGYESKDDYENEDDYEQSKRYQKAEEPQSGSLPFTGLEIWQLGLLGVVLIGGGFTARRLLTS